MGGKTKSKDKPFRRLFWPVALISQAPLEEIVAGRGPGL
jgi:hypothetical protein